MNGHGKLPMMRPLIKSACCPDTKCSMSPFIVCKENSSGLWRRRAWQHLHTTVLFHFVINRHVLPFSSEVTLDLLRRDTLQGIGKSTQDQGSNPHPLHWQVDSYPLHSREVQILYLFFNKKNFFCC